jgi:hypothetical protein
MNRYWASADIPIPPIPTIYIFSGMLIPYSIAWDRAALLDYHRCCGRFCARNLDTYMRKRSLVFGRALMFFSYVEFLVDVGSVMEP